MGFLDLPPEIRNIIYDKLLIRRNAVFSLRYKTLTPQGQYRTDPFVVGIHSVIDIKDSPPHLLTLSSPSRFCLSDTTSPPTTAILSTCRTIAKEATLMLYHSKTFDFSYNPIDTFSFGNPINTACLSSKARDEQKSCKSFLDQNSQNWSRLPYASRYSPIAAFLHTIGPANASSITSLSFQGNDANLLAIDLHRATVIATHHLKSLRCLTVRGNHVGFGALEELHLALEGFIANVTWLQGLQYEGRLVEHELQRLRDWMLIEAETDNWGWRTPKVLEDVVRRRTEGRAE